MAQMDKCPQCGLYVNNIKENGCNHTNDDLYKQNVLSEPVENEFKDSGEQDD